MSAARKMRRRSAAAAATAAVLLLLGWSAAPAGAADARYEGSSSEGARVFFSTDEKILPAADKDTHQDVYQRAGTVTSLVSFGPFGGNRPFNAEYAGASADGTHIYFTTAERLVQQDTDSTLDVYERTAGTTVLVSRGDIGGGNVAADFAAASADGSRVVFITAEALVATDTDGASDIYLRTGGATTLLSPGGTAAGAQFAAASADATRVFFVTNDSLVAADTDTAQDVYESVNEGAPVLTSTGPISASPQVDAVFGTISDDGTHAFFETSEALVAADTDSSADVYDRSGGTTALVSVSAIAGDGAFDVSFVGRSGDGAHAYFSTAEQLVAEDSDAQPDLYDHGPGGTVLVSTGPAGGNGTFIPSFNRASSNGSHVFFTTGEQLTSSDTDSSQDIYVRTPSSTVLVSSGTAESDAFFAASSTDGTRALFLTTESLAAEDTDSSRDVYEWTTAATTLVSTGPNEFNGPFGASLGGATPDLAVAYIETGEHLTADDFDLSGEVDVFARSVSGTDLKTAGGQTGPVVDVPTVTGSIPGSPSSDETPMIIGTGVPANSLVRLYATANCTEETPLGAGTGAAFTSTGIEITVAQNAVTPIRATATDANGNISECSPTAFNYTEDSLAPGPPSVTSTNPTSPANNNAPKILGTAETGGTVNLYASADCSGSPAATGTAAQFATPGLTISVANNSTTSLTARVTDAAGNVSACSAVATYIEDSTPAGTPVLTATTPPSPADDETPLVKGTAPAGSTVRLYKGSDCSGPVAATGSAAALAGNGIEVIVPNDDTTAIRAVATSAAGNVSPCSAPIVYVEDSTAPGAPALSLGSRARSNDNRVVVRGEAGANTLIYIFRGANCQGTSAGSGTAQELAAGIALTVADNSTVEFHAVAVDPARNASPCSAPLSYTEDSRAPRTRITFGPAFKTRDRTPTFRFLDESEDPTTWFQCKVDRKKFRRCSSPKTFKGLRPGRHTIQVRARDAAGNKERRAVKRRFKIVR